MTERRSGVKSPEILKQWRKITRNPKPCNEGYIPSKGKDLEGYDVSQTRTFGAILFYSLCFFLCQSPSLLMYQSKVLDFTFVFTLRWIIPSFHILGFHVIFLYSMFKDFVWFSFFLCFKILLFSVNPHFRILGDFSLISRSAKLPFQHSIIMASRLAPKLTNYAMVTKRLYNYKDNRTKQLTKGEFA